MLTAAATRELVSLRAAIAATENEPNASAPPSTCCGRNGRGSGATPALSKSSAPPADIRLNDICAALGPDDPLADNLGARVAELRDERDRLKAALAERTARAEAETSQRDRMLAARAEELEDTRRRLAAADALNRSYKNSTSWKATAPLRRVIDTLRGVKAFFAPAYASADLSTLAETVAETNVDATAISAIPLRTIRR